MVLLLLLLLFSLDICFSSDIIIDESMKFSVLLHGKVADLTSRSSDSSSKLTLSAWRIRDTVDGNSRFDGGGGEGRRGLGV
jgi:hypothetical protein